MPSRPLSVDQLLASIGRSPRGSHQSELPRATLAVLEEFVTYLVRVEGKSPNTARAYKSWVAKALVEHGASESHVKSAVKALGRFRASR